MAEFDILKYGMQYSANRVWIQLKASTCMILRCALADPWASTEALNQGIVL
jgi:hypothetical protein